MGVLVVGDDGTDTGDNESRREFSDVATSDDVLVLLFCCCCCWALSFSTVRLTSYGLSVRRATCVRDIVFRAAVLPFELYLFRVVVVIVDVGGECILRRLLES